MDNKEEIVSWTSCENGKILLDTAGTWFIYVRVTDMAGNSAILNSEGIVIYEDSVLKTEEIDYTYEMNEDRLIEIELKGNTIGEIRDDSGNVVDAANYTIETSGSSTEIMLKAAYLDTIAEGTYTYSICLNPQEIETNIVQLVYDVKLTVEKKEEEKPDEPEKEEVIRIFGTDRNETSAKIANTFCEDVKSVVVAVGKNGKFADGLCGGPLAAALNVPLLLTEDGQTLEAAGYVAEKTISGGYVLGGTGALAEETVNSIFKKQMKKSR